MIGKRFDMTNNTTGAGRLTRERSVANRNALREAEWEFANPSRGIMRSLDHRNAHRRIKHYRSSLHRGSLALDDKEKKPGSTALRDIGNSIRADTQALLESVSFNRGSIEEFVSVGLSVSMGKAEANLVAIELGRLINSSVYKHGLTIEERAVNSEIGRRLAEYFALTYFEDQDEAKALMVLVNAFIEKNWMLEKGYYFWDGQAYEAYKPVPISFVYKLGDVHWSRETAEAFRSHERIVEETINNAVASVDDNAISARLAQIMEKLGMICGQADEDITLRNIQWVLDLQYLFLSNNIA